MKKFEKMYDKIISEMYTDDDFERMKKHGLNATWVKFLQDNGFKELADRRWTFQKEKGQVILQINLSNGEINFIWWSGEIFYRMKNIDLSGDPATVINSAIHKCSGILLRQSEAVNEFIE